MTDSDAFETAIERSSEEDHVLPATSRSAVSDEPPATTSDIPLFCSAPPNVSWVTVAEDWPVTVIRQPLAP